MTVHRNAAISSGYRATYTVLARKPGCVLMTHCGRRLLDVQRIGHDCSIGEAAFQDMQKPVTVGEQRAAGLRFADPRVQGLLHVLLLFLLVQGTSSDATVGALQRATGTVPIVFVTVIDPVGGRWFASLARPGGNATGFAASEFSLPYPVSPTAAQHSA